MIKKGIHIATAFLLLVSTIGFSMHMHYCEGHLYDASVFAPAEKCCTDGDKHNQPHSLPFAQHCSLNETMDHCEDIAITMKPVDEFVASAYPLQHNEVSIISVLFPAFAVMQNISGNDKELLLTVRDHSDIPPPKIQTTLARFQRYLL